MPISTFRHALYVTDAPADAVPRIASYAAAGPAWDLPTRMMSIANPGPAPAPAYPITAGLNSKPTVGSGFLYAVISVIAPSRSTKTFPSGERHIRPADGFSTSNSTHQRGCFMSACTETGSRVVSMTWHLAGPSLHRAIASAIHIAASGIIISLTVQPPPSTPSECCRI